MAYRLSDEEKQVIDRLTSSEAITQLAKFRDNLQAVIASERDDVEIKSLRQGLKELKAGYTTDIDRYKAAIDYLISHLNVNARG